MEKKINIAELLKDCPQGMELDCTMFDGLEFDHIDVNSRYPIACRVKLRNGGYNIYRFNQYGHWNDYFNAKCVIFPKGKTTWEGFQRPFKDGDIIFTHANCLKVGLGNTWVSIYQENRNGGVATYVDCAEDGSDYYSNIDDDKPLLCMEKDIMRQRFATEEEKQKLFDAIKANGYKWKAETKTLEKLIEPTFKVGDVIQDIDTYKVKITEVNKEDECYEYESMIAKGIGCIPFNKQDDWELVPNKFDIATLVPFDSRVLVRDRNNDEWRGQFFSHYSNCSDRPYICIGIEGVCEYKQCIPFKSNEHLLGKTDDCDDYYKTWE